MEDWAVPHGGSFPTQCSSTVRGDLARHYGRGMLNKWRIHPPGTYRIVLGRPVMHKYRWLEHFSTPADCRTLGALSKVQDRSLTSRLVARRLHTARITMFSWPLRVTTSAEGFFYWMPVVPITRVHKHVLCKYEQVYLIINLKHAIYNRHDGPPSLILLSKEAGKAIRHATGLGADSALPVSIGLRQEANKKCEMMLCYEWS